MSCTEADKIKQTWLTPESQPGDRLPTERALEVHFQVSRTTISRALAALEAEGLIEMRRGSGAYVREKTLAPPSEFQMIGFIAPHLPPKEELQNPVLQRIGFGVERRASELGYQALMASSQFSLTHEIQLIEQFIQMGVAGIVLYPTRHLSDSTDPLETRWREFPLVLADIGSATWGRSMVQIDNFRLGHDLTNVLLRHGHRNIAFLRSHSAHLHNSVTDRQRGWEVAHTRAGLTIPESYHGWPASLALAQGSSQEDCAEAIVEELLKLSPRPDAIIAWDDPMAIALIGALQRNGIAVPEEVRVAGFDNYEAGRFFQPPFPTTAPEFIRLGETAVELLDEQIRGLTTPPRTILLSATIHPRGIL
ncbi:GntR family transcriptional regulator [Armatimonas sp.]|uniref:GntR family transcriptional regulator n=1 Tax=Armatimonas sp. TaxID=1872638 RepID=UPI00286A6DA9|nr:GntR family transcriptional regulator [Armatimonas sp.]